MDYTYTISSDFPNGRVDISQFEQEIRNSGLATELDYVSSSNDECKVVFFDTLSQDDENALDALVAAHIPVQEEVIQPNLSKLGNMKIESQPPTGIRKTIASHDWTDPTTWYQKSSKVTDEILEVEPNTYEKRFRSDHGNWINLYEGKVVDEDRVRIDGDYGVTIKVNDVEKTHGVDYRINFEQGQVEFEWFCPTGQTMGMGGLEPSDVVKATYSHSTSSVFTIGPSAGKRMRISAVEVQFTENCIISTATMFAAFAYNPYDLPNKIEVPGSRDTYKSAKDFISIGNQGVGHILPFGGMHKGIRHKVLVFPFNYQAAIDLESSVGAEIRVWLENDINHIGEYSTVTFYCTEEDE